MAGVYEMKLANKPHSTVIEAWGVNAKNEIIVHINAAPDMLSMAKLAGCYGVLLLDSDHKIIKVK